MNNLISIVIPVYNEEKSLASFLDICTSLKEKYPQIIEVIVVDDASSDQSGNILKPRNDIYLITNAYNLGYGASLKRGIRQAKGEWIFIIDADGTYPIERLIDFLPYLSDYDMVVGSRAIENNNIPLLRRPAKKFLNWFASFIVKFPIPDLNSGMRLFRREYCLEFWGLYPSRFSFTSTITLAFIRSNYLIKYIPIDYYKRIGDSSISPWDFFGFLALVFRIAFYFNPLRFLIPFSLVFILTGFIKGFYDLFNINLVGNFSILLIILGLMILVTGLLVDLLFRQRYQQIK